MKRLAVGLAVLLGLSLYGWKQSARNCIRARAYAAAQESAFNEMALRVKADSEAVRKENTYLRDLTKYQIVSNDEIIAFAKAGQVEKAMKKRESAIKAATQGFMR